MFSLRLRYCVAVGALIAGVACAPAAPAPTPLPTQPAASPTLAMPATPAPSLSPRVAASPSPSPSPSPAGVSRRALIQRANAAFDRKEFATAAQLYRQAADDPSLGDPTGPPHPVPPGPELRAFARFRFIVASALLGNDDAARDALTTARQQDANTAFLRLDLLFWDTYGMTADPEAACRQVTQAVEERPEPVLRSLNGWGPAFPNLEPRDVCRIPA